MPNQVKVFDEIQILGDAKKRANVTGPMFSDQPSFFTHFLEHTLDETLLWSVSENGASDDISINVAEGGHCRLTSGTSDNDASQLYTTAIWTGDKNAICEARIRINDVSQTALFFGFSDDSVTSDEELAIHYEDGVEVKDATNGVGFVIDADETTYANSSILVAGVAAGVIDTVVDSEVNWTDGAWHILRVELRSAANTPEEATNCSAALYLDGKSVGYLDDAAVSSSALGVSFHIGNRAGSAETIDVDYCFAYQDL